MSDIWETSGTFFVSFYELYTWLISGEKELFRSQDSNTDKKVDWSETESFV